MKPDRIAVEFTITIRRDATSDKPYPPSLDACYERVIVDRDVPEPGLTAVRSMMMNGLFLTMQNAYAAIAKENNESNATTEQEDNDNA